MLSLQGTFRFQYACFSAGSTPRPDPPSPACSIASSTDFTVMLAGLNHVTLEFGARVIVDDATWHIQPGERIGLIGYNGTGKSTLLKLLVGEYAPSAGTVERSRSTTIGYLHQDLLSLESSQSILQVALSAFERVLQQIGRAHV